MWAIFLATAAHSNLVNLAPTTTALDAAVLTIDVHLSITSLSESITSSILLMMSSRLL